MLAGEGTHDRPISPQSRRSLFRPPSSGHAVSGHRPASPAGPRRTEPVAQRLRGNRTREHQSWGRPRDDRGQPAQIYRGQHKARLFPRLTFVRNRAYMQSRRPTLSFTLVNKMKRRKEKNCSLQLRNEGCSWCMAFRVHRHLRRVEMLCFTRLR